MNWLAWIFKCYDSTINFIFPLIGMHKCSRNWYNRNNYFHVIKLKCKKFSSLFYCRIIPLVYVPTSNAEETEVEWVYEDLQDLLELTPKKDVLFITRDWNTKVGSQEIPGVTGNFGLGVQNETGQRLTEICQENALVIANTLFQQHKRRLYTWTSPDGQHRN